MSRSYKPPRSRNLYVPDAENPFKLSRSKIDLFVKCPRCFYIDRRLGIGHPPGFPFNLNSAVDSLLKSEFDIHREAGTQHPLLEEYGVDARPAVHDQLDEWRNNNKGVQFLHTPTNLMITGAIDDLWQNSGGEYLVVDYKATSKKERITALNEGWQRDFKRQLEIYQWLLRRNGYEVSDTAYWVYCNGQRDRASLDAKLDFDITLIPYKGDDSWVEDTIKSAHACLNVDDIPAAGENCNYCVYNEAVGKVTAGGTRP